MSIEIISGKIKDIAKKIYSLDSRVTENGTQIQYNSADISDLDLRVGNNSDKVVDLTNKVNTNSTTLSDLSTEVNNNNSSITDLSTKVKANGDSITTLNSSVKTNADNITALGTRVTTNANTLTTLSNSVKTNADNISALTTRVNSMSSGSGTTTSGGATAADLTTLETRMRLYIQSRNGGLITNGSGLMKDNTNFSRFKFNPLDFYAGYGCFTSDVLNADYMIDEFIPVSPTATYEFSFACKTLKQVGQSRFYSYLACYDLDSKAILPHNIPFVTFRLGETLLPGSKTIVIHPDDRAMAAPLIKQKINSAASWFLLKSNYVSANGFAFPMGEYSQDSYGGGVPPIGNITFDETNGIINGMLTNIIPAGGLPAGTPVSIGQSGGTYVYWIPAAVNTTVPNVWTPFSLRFVPQTITRKFTASVKVGWLTNRDSQAGNIQAYSAIDMRTVEPAKA